MVLQQALMKYQPLAHLKWMSEISNDSSSSVRNTVLEKIFILTADIDASDTTTWDENTDGIMDGFKPIAKLGASFEGQFDGRNHTISNLFINRQDDSASLFRLIGGGEIKNLSLMNVNITGRNAAPLAHIVTSSGSPVILTNIHTSGLVHSPKNAGSAAGLIIQAKRMTLSHCSSTATVTSLVPGGGSPAKAGGLICNLLNDSGMTQMKNCYFAGSVSADAQGTVGGLVHNAVGSTMVNCINYGSVNGHTRGGIANLAGANSANIGGTYQGLISMGDMGGSGDSIFYDYSSDSATVSDDLISITDAVGSGVTNNLSAAELTIAQLDQAALETIGFDFDTIWEMNGGQAQLQDIALLPEIQIPVSGDGNELSPYQITNLAELMWVSENPTSWNKYFVLMNDIDAQQSFEIDNNNDGILDGLSLIGSNSTAFTGYFNGDGFTIQNLTVDNSTGGNDGIFGVIGNTGVIRDIFYTYLEVTSDIPVGDGTEVNPYQISTLAEFRWVTENSSLWTKHFILTADIYASSASAWHRNGDGIPDGFSPIGYGGVSFRGTFDGAGFSIQGLSENIFGSEHSNSEITNLTIAYTSSSIGGGLSLTMPQSAIYPGDVFSIQVRVNAIGVYGIDGNMNLVRSGISSIDDAVYDDFFW